MNTILTTCGTDNSFDRESLEFRGAMMGLTQVYMDQLGDIDLSRQVVLKEIKEDKCCKQLKTGFTTKVL